MPYPIDLLSNRRKGGLLYPAWLAANTNEKAFKRHFKSNTIKKMNVEQICNEIMEAVQTPDKSKSLSLRQASQLMHGVTKIRAYQTAFLQKEVYEFEQNVAKSLKKKKDDAFEDFDAAAALNEIENIEPPAMKLSLSTQNLSDAQLGPDLHLLPEEPGNMLQAAIQEAAHLNFGFMNDKEWEIMLQSDEDILLDMQRKDNVQIDQEKDISERMADMTITEEVHRERQLSQEILSPVLTKISKGGDKSKQRLSLTPQKRQPPQIQIETPTKRRRLSFETATITVPPVEDVAVPAPEELPLLEEETRTLVRPQQTESDMEIESLHSSTDVIRKRSKKIKTKDQNIALTNDLLLKWRQDVKIHCRELERPISLKHHQIPARDLFKQPSFLPKQWHACLRDTYIKNISKSFKSVDEDVALAELAQPQEAIRVEETISRLNLPTEDLSTFAKTDTAIVAEVDSINILPIKDTIHETMNVLVPPFPEAVPDTITFEEGISTVEQRRDQIEMSNLNNIEESFEDIETLLQKQRHPSKPMDISESSASSSESMDASFASPDILAMLNVLWAVKPYVKFSELISEEEYTKEDAATAFSMLLELHSEEKLFLQQSECFHTLRIWKHRQLED